MPPITLPNLPRRRTPTQVQRAVLVALVIRELRGRVQGHWLGLMWMLFEPLAHILVLLGLIGFRHHVVTINIDYPVFLVTGLLPFFLFRNLARQLSRAVAGNRPLYAYRQVKPIDALVARSLVEIGLFSAVYSVAMALLGWWGYHWLPFEPLELILVTTVLLVLAVSLGLFFTVVGHGRPKVEYGIRLLFLPLYIFSGVIFPVRNLPVNVQHWLLWNPVLHLIDLSRAHFIPFFQTLPGVELGYPIKFSLVTVALALAMYRLKRHDLAAGS